MSGTLKGRKLNNRYLVGERIGIGGMAEVYQGQDTVLGRTVAIKVMLPQYAEDESFTTRFRQEAASAANLQSPYIVNVYDWGQDDNTSFIVMEYVRGSDLKTAIKQRGAINQRKVAEIGSQVCQALAVAHNLDIVHRDIKPQNIMVQPDGNVKVMDFGIARAKNSVMEKTSAVLGTAHYISPEQAQGKDLTSASDIYSLGVVLYEAATGQLPFDGPDAVSVALKQVNEEPLPPREVNPDIDVNLEAIIMKAMSKNPLERFATARDMRHALNDFLAGRPVNIVGFSGAQTALMTETISDVGARPYQTDKTKVIPTPSVIDAPEQTSAGSTLVSPVATGKNGKQVKTNKPRRRVIIAICVLVALAAVAGLSYALLGQGASGSKGVEVPELTGKTLTEAEGLITKAGFVLGDDIQFIYDDKVEADIVIGQTPRAGTTQEKGSTIELTVSKGTEQVQVPDLSDMNANDARAALSRVGLKYETGAAEYSDTVKENRVLRQSPEAGEMVDKGSTVTYYLSAGVEKVSVPNVVGDYEASATATLENAGFKVKVDYAPDDYTEQGCVISQSPTSQERTDEGATVSIVVSTGPSYFSASAYVNDDAGGSVSPEYVAVDDGGSASFTISTKPGYSISSVTDSNGNSYGDSSVVTISNIKSDVTLSVTFVKDGEEDPDNPDDESDDGEDDDIITDEIAGEEDDYSEDSEAY